MKNSILKSLMLLVCLVLVISVCAGCGGESKDKEAKDNKQQEEEKQETREVTFLASPSSVATYVMAFSLGEIAQKEHPWLRINATETPGFIYNLKELGQSNDRWEDNVVGVAQG